MHSFSVGVDDLLRSWRVFVVVLVGSEVVELVLDLLSDALAQLPLIVALATLALSTARAGGGDADSAIFALHLDLDVLGVAVLHRCLLFFYLVKLGFQLFFESRHKDARLQLNYTALIRRHWPLDYAILQLWPRADRLGQL